MNALPLVLLLPALGGPSLGAELAPGAVDPADFPWVVEVDPAACAACDAATRAGRGVLRIPIPAALRSAADPVDGSDLALLDAQGRPLSFAVARGEGPEEMDLVAVQPTEDPQAWLLDLGPRPVDGLEIDLRGMRWVATARVERESGSGWVPLGEPALIWNTDQGRQNRLWIPPTRGRVRLHLTPHLDGARPRVPSVLAVLHGAPHVAPTRWELMVDPPALLEEGLARTVVRLDHPLPITAMHLGIDGPVFERQAAVMPLWAEGAGLQLAPPLPGSSLDLPLPGLDQSLRRVQLGGADLDEVRLSVPGPASDTLLVYIGSAGLLPLDLRTVTLEMPGEEVLVVDPGPGPLTLLAGADPGSAPQSDLQVALPELSRAAGPPLPLGPRRDNPAWVPPELQSGLAAPSTALDLDGLRFAWELRSPEGRGGLVRIALPAELLADSRPDLGDLRLVDAEGRQIPYLLRRSPQDQALEIPAPSRAEDGGRSRLRIALPRLGEAGDGAVVSTVRLRTSVPLFRRTVTLYRVLGPNLEPLRSYRWEGDERPLRLDLQVDRVVGEELVVEIDNGDDPPLPIDEIEVLAPAWELLAVLPPGEGLRLLHGDPRRPAPDYDLALLAGRIGQRAAPLAELGPKQALRPPPVPLLERAVLLAGIGVLIAGLGTLVLGLLRAVPPEPGSVSPE